MPSAAPFTISRVFNAPRDVVFKVNTDPVHLKKWMGAEPFKAIRTDMDLRVGGRHHYGMENSQGHQMWGKQVYREIVPNEKLVFLQSFSDKDGGLTRHPMAADWPLEMLSTTTFASEGADKTRLTITWLPYESDDAGNATFDAARANMGQGFAGMFANLEAYLARL